MKIALIHFAFDRLEIFKECFERSLELRPSELNHHHYVFLDGSSNKRSNKAVLEYLRTRVDIIHLIEREYNMGLKENILSGVSMISQDYDGFIVLEDDIFISKGFFDFMLASLKHRDENIGHISAWNYPGMGFLNGTYTGSIMNCWGWATWSDIWDDFIPWFNRKDYLKCTKREINKMNYFWLSGFSSQFKMNLEGSLKTWAIFWYLFLVSYEYNTLQPFRSLVLNRGLLNGTNTTRNPDVFTPKLHNVSSLERSRVKNILAKVLVKVVFFLRLFKKIPRLIYGKISRL